MTRVPKKSIPETRSAAHLTNAGAAALAARADDGGIVHVVKPCSIHREDIDIQPGHIARNGGVLRSFSSWFRSSLVVDETMITKEAGKKVSSKATFFLPCTCRF